MTRTTSLARRRFELMAAEYLERMGARIARRREELGLTQDEVARQMPGKITGQRISLWERGKNRPRDDSLEALAAILNVPVSYLLASEPDKTSTPDLLNNGRGNSENGQPTQLDRMEAKLDMILGAMGLALGESDAPAELVQIFKDAAVRAHAARQSEPAEQSQRRAKR